jgi:hypothetical protein
MHGSAPTGLAQLNAALTAALEAAAEQAGRRAKHVIMTARLATAVRMRQAAEHASALSGQAKNSLVSSTEAVPAGGAVAARLVRRGGKQ